MAITTSPSLKIPKYMNMQIFVSFYFVVWRQLVDFFKVYYRHLLDQEVKFHNIMSLKQAIEWQSHSGAEDTF